MRNALKYTGALALAFALLVFVVPVAVAVAQELEPAAAAAAASAAAAPTAAWWTAAIPIAWMVLTAIVNTIAHYATPADVDAWAETNPRLAQGMSILRRFGIEPVAGLQAIFDFFAKNPPPLGHGAAVGKPEARFARPRPAPSAAGFVDVYALSPLACFLLSCGLVGAVVPTTSLAICVYDFIEQHAGLTLLEYTAESAVACESDELAVLDTLIADDVPAAVKPLQAEAKALREAGGPKLAAFAQAAHTRAGAIRAERAAAVHP
jgi:hypothetical protein